MNNKKMFISENHRCCWLDLPQEILELIMKRLFYADLLNFRAVCKSWNSINRGGTVPSKQSPWLLMFEKVNLTPPPGASYSEMVMSWKRNSKGCSCKLFDPVYKKTYTINNTNNIDINFYLIQNVYASKHGWILSSAEYLGQDDCSLIFAYTPFSNVNNFIKLPALELCHNIQFATFTSNPSSITDNDDQEKNCLFVVLHDFSSFTYNNYVTKGIIISTCRPEEKCWSSRALNYCLPVSEFDSYTGDEKWIYSQGNLYYIIHRLGKQQLAGQQQKIRTVRVVKWELSMKSRSFHKFKSGRLVYSSPVSGSVMNKELLEHDEDDLLSKLEKDHFSIPNEFKLYHRHTAGTEYESCLIQKNEYEACSRGKMVKIDPPHY